MSDSERISFDGEALSIDLEALEFPFDCDACGAAFLHQGGFDPAVGVVCTACGKRNAVDAEAFEELALEQMADALAGSLEAQFDAILQRQAEG